jgi:hypothetical protein
MNLQSKKDIIRLTANETGKSRLQVEMVVEDLEKTLLFLIRNPIVAGKEIILKRGQFIFLRFSIKLKYMNRLYRKMYNRNPDTKTATYIREFKKKYYV